MSGFSLVWNIFPVLGSMSPLLSLHKACVSCGYLPTPLLICPVQGGAAFTPGQHKMMHLDQLPCTGHRDRPPGLGDGTHWSWCCSIFSISESDVPCPTWLFFSLVKTRFIVQREGFGALSWDCCKLLCMPPLLACWTHFKVLPHIILTIIGIKHYHADEKNKT